MLASFTPISRNFTPCAASGAISPRVWPGTSVILAPVVVRPKRRSSDCDRPMPPEIIDCIHQLGLPGEWERMPCDVAGGDGLFHARAFLGRRLLQIFVKQP